DVEGDVGRAVAHHLARLLDDALDAELCHVFDMNDGHAAVVGELPEELGGASDADLDRALGIEHAVEDRVAERAAVVELRALVLAARVAMRIEMDEPDRAVAGEALQDRIGD